MKTYIVVYNYNYKLQALPLIYATSYTDAYIQEALKIPENALITSVVEVIG